MVKQFQEGVWGMRMYDIIARKRDGCELSTEEIKYFIEGYTKGMIPDYQASALLMAVYLRGMNERETADLTIAMADSGKRVDTGKIKGKTVDKHSTGGVGDTTTLVLIPLVASAGVPVVKMSGRGLGYTGGTIDKLESIPGFKTNFTTDGFIKNVNKINACIMAQSPDIAPADGKLYALRDVTATVESIPLIASSIMSKKIASGADSILLDVKVGSGAFMKDLKEAEKLANCMVKIGNNLGRKTVAFITDMNQPLGLSIGNSLEVREAIMTLKGEGSSRLKEACIAFGSCMLMMAEIVSNEAEARAIIENNLRNKKGLNKLKEIIMAQKGNPEVVENPDLLPISRQIVEYKSDRTGYINDINAEDIGKAALYLGAGREKKEDKIDPTVGIVLNKRLNDRVIQGETIAYIYVNNGRGLKEAVELLNTAIVIDETCPKVIPPLIYKIIA